MPTFLTDPPQFIYLLLGAALVFTGAIAAQKQDRRAVTAFATVFLFVLLVFLIDKLVESPREEAVRRVYMLQIAADARNPDAFVEHVADKVSVQTDTGQMKVATREELKHSGFWSMLKQFDVRVSVSGFSREDVKVIDDSTVEIGFVAKGESGGKQIPIYARATFGKQADGSYKLTAFRSFEFIDRTKAFPIPNFP